jgi:hypothetical protein
MSGGATFIEWISRHPQVHSGVVAAVILAAFIASLRTLWRSDVSETKNHDWAWGFVLLAILAVGRWPSMVVPRPFNADEGQLLAGAHTLTHDPVFWRSVNGWTAGPLDFFALWPAGWIGGWDSCFPARITAWVLIGTSLIFIHQCLALLTGRASARLASLAVATLEALTNAPDFLHYSTELVPILLQSAAFYTVTRRWLGGGTGWCLLGGLLLGAVPFAKLQAAPLAALTGIVWLAAAVRSDRPDRNRAALLLAGGALLPGALITIQLTVTSAWPDFVASYWTFNLYYAGTLDLGLSQVLRETFAASVAWDGLLDYWLPLAATVCVFLLAWPLAPAGRATRLVLLAGLASLAALVCVLTPHRPFLHYWQLLMPPLASLLGVAFARPLTAANPNAGRRRLFIALGAASLVLTPLLHRVMLGDRYVPHLAANLAAPRSTLATRVLTHAHPGESLAVWGWTNHLYVETGLRQGTRDSHVQFLLEPGPLREYFRERYLADVGHRRPELFVDTIGPASLALQAPAMRHERNFPALAALISSDYALVEETPEARIYRRKDLPGR